MAFLALAIQTSHTYRELGEKAMAQVPDEALVREPGEGVNSMAILVNHLAGNMLSRWTDFLTMDGEKSWRHRDREFEPVLQTREDIMRRWDEGWDCLFATLEGLNEEDLSRQVLIRAEAHTVEQAIVRQLAHYAYHVGQMVYLGKIIQGDDWQSLSIPRGQSDAFNRTKMG